MIAAGVAVGAAALALLVLVPSPKETSTTHVAPPSKKPHRDGIDGFDVVLESTSEFARTAVTPTDLGGEPRTRVTGTNVHSSDAECGLDVFVRIRGSDSGLEGAEVEIRTLSLHGEALDGDATERVERGNTDGGGRTFLTLMAGSQEVLAWKGDLYGQASIELLPGDRASVIVELDPIVLVLGKVVNENDFPIEGANIWLDKFGPALRVTSDGEGRFEFPYLPAAGTIQVLHVQAQGYGRESVRLSAQLDGRWTSQLAWLASEDDLPPRVPKPRAMSPPPPQRVNRAFLDRQGGALSGNQPPVLVANVRLAIQCALVGRIVDENGAPIVDATVHALGHYIVRPGMAYPHRMSSSSRADGRFEIEGLRSDVSYQVESRAVGRGTYRLLVPPSGDTVHDCGTIVLLPELAIRGRVLEAEGLPVEGILVRATALIEQLALDEAHSLTWPRDPAYVSPLDREVRTDEAGVFALDQLAPGHWRLSVEGQLRVWKKRIVDLQAGGVPPIELRLPSSASVLQGQVWRGGVEAGSMKVHARSGTYRCVVTSDARGRFRFAGLPAAVATISCSTWHPTTATWDEGEVEVEVGKSLFVDLVMTPHEP